MQPKHHVMNVACCQFDIGWEDKPANYLRVERRVREANLAPGTLLLLPEMFATGFSMDADAIAELPDGATAGFLANLARGHGLYVLGGVVLANEDSTQPPRNEALLFAPTGEQISRYAKVHRFSFAREDKHYAAGDAPVFCTIDGWNVQPTICYDLRFPELYRAPGVRGAELICVIANWPAARDSHWMAMLKARAIENQAYVAGVNRCGRDPNVEYSGHSQIISPRGQVIEDAGDRDTVIRAELDIEKLREYRAKFPALNAARL
jgi:predicted amidohydrolase